MITYASQSPFVNLLTISSIHFFFNFQEVLYACVLANITLSQVSLEEQSILWRGPCTLRIFREMQSSLAKPFLRLLRGVLATCSRAYTFAR